MKIPLPIAEARWRRPLCPYLMTGNHRILIHLDAFLVPQSLQWPAPGAPERIGKRNLCDEWPYWKELPREEIAREMPYFRYEDGHIETLDSAPDAGVEYIGDTNVLNGFWRLSGGAEISQISFTAAHSDCWLRHYRITGTGQWVLRGEFFDQAVRGHALCHLGNTGFRGFLQAAPEGVFVLHFDVPCECKGREFSFRVDGSLEFTVYFSLGRDLAEALSVYEKNRKEGYAQVLAGTMRRDTSWCVRAKRPVSDHPFILKNYKRWLLSNWLLAGENGFSISGVRPFWSFAWPRDCCQQALGFAAAGFVKEARVIVGKLLDIAPESGVYEARYKYDGSPMKLDNRPHQRDHAGFVCRTSAILAGFEDGIEWARSIGRKVFRLADSLAAGTDHETGLPLPAADHHETVICESLSNALAAVSGLMGAADLAERLDEASRAGRYRTVAKKMLQAIEKELWVPDGKYFRTSVKPENPIADIAIGWAAQPLEVWSPDNPKLRAGILKIYRERWDREAGGIINRPDTPYASHWMYYASILLLGLDGIGERDKASEIVSALAVNSSPQGLIPEQTALADGEIIGCAPLPPPQANLLFHAYFEYTN